MQPGFGSLVHLPLAQKCPDVIMHLLKWWSCKTPNKRGRVSALLEPLQHALARMEIYDDRTVKTTARTLRKLQIHSHNLRHSSLNSHLCLCILLH